MRNAVTSVVASLIVTAALTGGCTAQRAPLVLIEPEYRHLTDAATLAAAADEPALELASPTLEQRTRLVEAYQDTTQRW